MLISMLLNVSILKKVLPARKTAQLPSPPSTLDLVSSPVGLEATLRSRPAATNTRLAPDKVLCSKDLCELLWGGEMLWVVGELSGARWDRPAGP